MTDTSHSTSQTEYGIGAEFDSAAQIYHAAEKVRDAGFKHWDVCTPYPIHGIDHAMGAGKSPLGYIVFCGGAVGLLIAVLLQFIPSTFLYPLIVQGKPTDWATIPAFVPILFELTVLCSAFTALFGMLILNFLPRYHHPLFNWDRFTRVTDDGFFLVIEKRDPKYDEKAIRRLLEGNGGHHITVITDDDGAPEKAGTADSASPGAEPAKA
jgi:hypothetical protein